MPEVFGEPPGGAPVDRVDHLHADRQDLPHLRGPIDEFGPEAVVDNCAYSAADAETALAAIGDDVRLLVVSSMDVYRAYGRTIGTEPQGSGRASTCRVSGGSPASVTRMPWARRSRPACTAAPRRRSRSPGST